MAPPNPSVQAVLQDPKVEFPFFPKKETPEFIRKGDSHETPTAMSVKKNHPKEEILGRIFVRTSGQKLRSGPPNHGKTRVLARARTSGADVLKKVWSEKLRAEFSFPTVAT